MAVNIETAINYMYQLQAKHITYSMTGSRTGADGTADCSGALYASLRQGGMPNAGWVLNTDSMHAWLLANGWKQVANCSNWEAKRGDVVIWGKQGVSGGEFGHTGIFVDHDNFINCNYAHNGVTVNNHDLYMSQAGVKYWYTYRYTGATNAGPTNIVKPATAATATYALHELGKGWLGNVVNKNDRDSNGYAGVPNHQHDLLMLQLSTGGRYRVHTREDGWLPWVYKGNKADTVNGCAGILGHAIDGVQIEANGHSVYYRSQTTQRAGWLDIVRGLSDYAGLYGEPLDRLQVWF